MCTNLMPYFFLIHLHLSFSELDFEESFYKLEKGHDVISNIHTREREVVNFNTKARLTDTSISMSPLRKKII